VRKRITLASAAIAGLLFAGATGCGSDDGAKDNGSPVKIQTQQSKYRGTELGTPFAKPDLTLTDTSGQPYNLKERTAGKVTLLYFGYTHCPDACPTTMADLARALTKLSPEDRAQINVVFVTTDPERDTLAATREWLDAFDKSFVGLRGDFPVVQAAAKTVGVAIDPPVVKPDGSVVSTHGTQTIAFSPDDKARVVYLASVGVNPDGTAAGITADDFAHDLPLLIHPEKDPKK
jgi:protein SCO1/2